MKFIKKPVSILLVMIMVVSLFTIIPFEVGAASGVQYIERSWDETNKKVVDTEKTCTSYTLLANRSSDTLYSGWYVVDRDMTVNGRLRVSGTVNLILCDHKTLTLKSGITVLENDTLNIYGQSDIDEKGKIYAHPEDSTDDFEMKDSAVIGGTVDDPNAGNIIIHGGTLDLDAPSHQGFFTNNDAACLGGGYKGTVKSVKVFGGTVKSESTNGGAAIGGGMYGAPSNGDGILIYGGKVEAKSNCASGDGAAAIGGGYDSPHASGTICIYGGEVQAKAMTGGAAIGSGEKTDSNNIVITGGLVIASAISGAGIGSGEGGRAHGITISDTAVFAASGSGAGVGSGEKGPANGVSVSNSVVIGVSMHGGAGIGSGYKGDCGDITASNSALFAYSKEFKSTDQITSDLEKMGSAYIPKLFGKEYLVAGLSLLGGLIYFLTPDHSGAAIGGGVDGDVTSIKLTDCYVKADSESFSSGIGSGEDGDFGTIEITDSEIEAESGKFGAAIGSGIEAEHCGTINITNSKVTTTAGLDAAGIGTGSTTEQSAAINITGSTVTSHGGELGAGIGGGGGVSGGTINISSSTVNAYGGRKGAGIGGGEWGNGGTITICNCNIEKAEGGKYAAGIGGGDDGDGGNITISNSTVKAYGGEDAAGIGGGEDGDGGHIEITDGSNVYAEGKCYGAGIGGGEDSNGEYCEIDSDCTVEAVSGGEGNVQSIGHGDCGWYVSSYTGGELSLGKRCIVQAGKNSGSTEMYSGNERFDAIWKNKYAKITPCSHPTKEWRYGDQAFHYHYCTVCGEELIFESERHTWDSDNKCTVCGAEATMVTVSFDEKDSSGNIITKNLTVPKHTEFTYPECENVPDGMEFVCWRLGPNDNFIPGETGIPNQETYEAVYLPVQNTSYIAADGKERTVKARVLDGTYDGLTLSGGWYVVEGDHVYECSFRFLGDVNLIIPDGKTLQAVDRGYEFYFLDGREKVSYLSIYGQREQTGTLNLGNDLLNYAELNIYGGRIISTRYSGGFGGTNSTLIAGGTVNAYGRLTVPKNGVIFSGGNANFIGAIVTAELQIGWTNLTDSFRIDDNITVTGEGTIKIADGQKMTDGMNVYSGTLTSEEITAIQGKTLTPYLDHNYSDPEWEWENEYLEATAVFRCTGCGYVQKVKAKVTYTDSGKNRTSTARCIFNGHEYTTTQTKQIIFDVTIANTAHGSVTANKANARAEDNIKLTITPDDGYTISKLYYTDSQGNKTAISGSGFTMPVSDVTVTAQFAVKVPAREPYIDGNGAYHLGNVAYFEIDGKYYAVNEDGFAGEELDTVELSYFDFNQLNDSTYQIKCYTGPMDELTRLRIPKTYNGKAVTVIGESNQSFMAGTGELSLFSFVLNENITTIKGSAFAFSNKVTAIEGDTSGLRNILNTPFSITAPSDGSPLTLNLDYPGRINVDSGAFTWSTIVARVKHATTLSSDGNASSVEYIITDDAHAYGEPVWTWANDHSSATAKFTCTDSRCRHEETVNADVTRVENEDDTIYTATAELDGKTYTDVKGAYHIRITGSEHGTVTADKTYADEGETVMLTVNPDSGYQLTSLAVKDVNGKAVTVTDNSFVMPAGGVSVSAAFGARTVNISVAGVGINGNNCSDILGDGTASYDFDTNTLTLTNANIEVTNGNGIRYNESSSLPFNIILEGENRIADDTDDGSNTCYGIALYAAAPGFTISGSGTLDIEMSSESPRIGIQARKALTLERVKVSVNVSGSGVELVYVDSILMLKNAARLNINSGGLALQSNRNVKNLNVGDDCFFEAISETQAFNGNIHLTDDHPDVKVNTNPSADGAGYWDGSTALTSYKYIGVRGDRAPYWVTIVKPQHGTVTSDLNRTFSFENEYITLTAKPDFGYELESITITDEEGRTITDNKSPLTFAMPASDVTVTATFSFSDGVGASVVGHSISLDGDIAVNFYMDLAPEIAQSKTAYMQFTIPDTSKEYQEQTVSVSEAEKKGDYYVFKCRVAAKDMNSEITAQILGIDKQSTKYNYSVSEYANWLLEHQNDNAAYQKAAPLVEKMLQYGAYAKAYFDNAMLDDLGEVEITAPESAFSLPDGVTFEGATLSLKSQTTLSLYFTSSTTLSFSMNGKTVETAKNGSYQVARIRGIAAGELQNSFTLTVTAGEAVGTVTYSPMNYCKNVLTLSSATSDEAQTPNPRLVNAVKALYHYSQAANEYFK